MTDRVFYSFGCGEGVVKNERYVELSYRGNMGSTLERSFIPHFEERFGLMTFDQIRNQATKEEGSADYLWMLKITKKRFEKIVGEKI